MVDPKKNQGRKRPGKNTFTTKSGNSITLNRSLTERIKAHRDAKARRRAVYLSTLPKNRFHRILYRLKPRELARYWFSRDGAIMALKLLGVAIVVFFVLVVGVFAYFRKDLPLINDVTGSKIGGSVTYYDRTGTKVLWQDYDAVKRVPVPGNQLPDYLRQATVAIEDKDFYKHGAFDVRGIIRAGLNDVFKKGGGVQGGSTISQQLVKLNENWTADRTITRKVKELILATELEREYSKADILNGYLNIAPYGPVEYGAQTAAQDYFGIDAKDLTLAQSVMLAAIPKSPNDYSPYGPTFDATLLKHRTNYILDQMAKQRMITAQQATEAKNVDVVAQVKGQPSSLYAGIQAPYFVLAAKQDLQNILGPTAVNRGGWKVLTTVDMDLQGIAERAVASDLPAITRQGGDNAAFVAEDNRTGQIVALVGGVDFNNDVFGRINFATDVNVSPGSSFKPYDYAAFIENRTDAGAGSVLYDQQGVIPGYPCTDKTSPKVDNPSDPDGSQKCLWDYDLKYPGPLTLRYSLGGSRNVPAVKAMLSAIPNDTSPGRTSSINKVISTAESMMATPNSYNCYSSSTDLSPGADPAQLRAGETQCYGSSAIGDGAYLRLDNHVNGIATLARMGSAIPHTYILKVTDSSNKEIYAFKQPTARQVLRPDTAYIVNDMASDPRASYLPGSCTDTTCRQFSQGASNFKFQRYNGWHFAVKTGTTNSGFDGLMASWSTQYTAVTWVGYHNRNKTMVGPGMEFMTEPIVRSWMQSAHDKIAGGAVNWQAPSGIKTLPAFIVRNHVGIGSLEPSPSNDLYPAWYVAPKGSSGGGNTTVDLVSNKTATSCTPDLAKKTEGGANVNSFSADSFFGSSGNTASTTEQDDVHNCNDAKPTITLTKNSCPDTNKCNFTVAVSQGTHTLSGGSYTTAPAGTVTLSVNGQVVQTTAITSEDAFNYTFTSIPVTDGQQVQAQVADSVLYSATDSLVASATSGPIIPLH